MLKIRGCGTSRAARWVPHLTARSAYLWLFTFSPDRYAAVSQRRHTDFGQGEHPSWNIPFTP